MDISKYNWVKNRFVYYIIDNKDKGFIYKFLFKRKLKNALKKLAPSFSDLVKMAEFLYYLDLIYLFENDADINGISGTINRNCNQFTIIVKPNKVHTIKIIMVDRDSIEIEITNNGKPRHKISFTDGNAEVDTRERELLFIHINDYLMDAFTKVLLKYI